LEQGSFRCDVNVSIRKLGDDNLGTRTEIKNVNSFRFVQRAIDYEVHRQASLVASGGRVIQETRGWDDRAGKTFSQRSKEEAHDYRYFPEPDLPPLELSSEWIESQRSHLPELPAAKQKRFVGDFGLSLYAASVLTSHAGICQFFEDTISMHANPVAASNFIQSEVLRDTTTDGLEAKLPIVAEQLAGLLSLVDKGTISGKQAKEVFSRMVGTDRSALSVVQELGMEQLSDVGAIEEICKAVIAANEKNAASYRSGKTALLGFFVGQVMKQTKGSASPSLVNEVLVRLLSS
jgi:aspartyl-tRNA(Asn)/glutamyl-tRNA(Gln) amidotransferase subunit B